MRYLYGLFLIAALSISSFAAAKPNVLFSEGCVLQQGIEVPVWGTASDGESVKVQFAGQTVSTTATGGKWMVKLKPLKAGGPFVLRINELEIKNVLVGEVWICSGQSNMEWQLKNTSNAAADIAAAKYPMIRLFTVPRSEVAKPETEVKGSWKECSPETVPNFSAVGYFFGRDLHLSLKVPIGLINNAVGGSPAESWMRDSVLNADADYKGFHERYPQQMEQYQKAMAKYREDVEKAKQANTKAPNAPGRPWMPSGLFNGMLAPLVPYAIKGTIWYQGESNAGRAYQYRRLFPDMIRNWRKEWGQGDFSFLWVQLAAYGPNDAKLGNSDWAELREAQTMTLSLPKTGQALAIDVGTYDDIHPRNKQPVGARLALAARSVTYGQKVEFQGPTYQSLKIQGSSIAITFRKAPGGIEARGGEPKGFIIAGEDKVWHQASAVIKGNVVTVSSTEVTKPVAVRYAWAKFPDCNLYNRAGLPAVPFRTDDWPGVTMPKAR